MAVAADAAVSGYSPTHWMSPFERANGELSNLERVRRFKVVPERFSVENGMMTATMKLRRHKVRETYGEAMEQLFDQKPHT